MNIIYEWVCRNCGLVAEKKITGQNPLQLKPVPSLPHKWIYSHNGENYCSACVWVLSVGIYEK